MSPFGYSHQHEDKLSFVLFAYGKSMLVESGNFHYDSSPMRRYVVSTRSHNTVRIDGRDQAAHASWRWREKMPNQKAQLTFSTTPGLDVAEACYDFGYGSRKRLNRSVTHVRRVDAIGTVPA